MAELARLFAEHPAWTRAAARIHEGSSSAVYFRHRPGEVWHLLRRGGETLLRPGPAPDPDFVFRFTPAAVAALAETDGNVPDFALRLFALILDPDEERRVDLRVVASFWTLARRGYLRLLLESGPRVVAFGARHGVGDLAALGRLVRWLREREPSDWEQPAPRAR